MVSRILVGATLAVGAAVAVAAPAGADPSVFNNLSCSCPQTVSNGGPSLIDQMERGIQAGQSGVDAVHADE
ncbi:hypothetical protein H7H82_12840 [Mycobacterium heidelbergense]|uniref:Uncharacterized protein n=1 Tax=Mycobacterium heidelbergense TaxID=53376 RepID=A0A1X0DS65_MYCHE|nr:hypothetical protein [Mycobacterium heidelbergense]MCV7051472.1 hypothetical protein [Mycobacterium heidelbergense]ORA75215.1 hypothetical protein BST25_06770 [Mycobacterium heidelbergense]BBZ49246.1 hypothetical protein MHEI_09630 [Mycobacterium heidelbergense]